VPVYKCFNVSYVGSTTSQNPGIHSETVYGAQRIHLQAVCFDDQRVQAYLNLQIHLVECVD